MLDQQCRSARPEHTIGHLGDFQAGREWLRDPFELAERLKLVHEVPQIRVFMFFCLMYAQYCAIGLLGRLTKCCGRPP